MDLSVKPPKSLKTYKSKQPPYKHMEGWLACRGILTLPSGGGKGIIMLNLALKFWRGCFSRIYLFSPTADVDHTWEPLKEYVSKHLMKNSDEQFFFTTFDEKKLNEILDTQKQIVQWQKKHEPTAEIHQTLILIDDLGSDKRISKHNATIDRLFAAGRHIYCSTLFAQQRWMMASSTCRSQATLLIYGKPRSELDWKQFAEENSALAGGVKNLEKMMQIATSEPYGFLTLDLLQKDPKKRWLNNFDTYLQIPDSK